MSLLRFGYITAPVLGALWMVVLSVTVAVAMSFATGDAVKPVIWMGLMAWYLATGVMLE